MVLCHGFRPTSSAPQPSASPCRCSPTASPTKAGAPCRSPSGVWSLHRQLLPRRLARGPERSDSPGSPTSSRPGASGSPGSAPVARSPSAPAPATRRWPAWRRCAPRPTSTTGPTTRAVSSSTRGTSGRSPRRASRRIPKPGRCELREIRPVSEVAGLAPRPLLLVHGSEDQSVPSFDARVVSDAHGSAELRIVSGAGHDLRHDPRAGRDPPGLARSGAAPDRVAPAHDPSADLPGFTMRSRPGHNEETGGRLAFPRSGRLVRGL